MSLPRGNYLKSRYEALRARGICVTCATTKTHGGARCEGCRRQHTACQSKYRDHRETQTGRRTVRIGYRRHSG